MDSSSVTKLPTDLAQPLTNGGASQAASSAATSAAGDKAQSATTEAAQKLHLPGIGSASLPGGSPDILIIAIIFGISVYGLILGHNKVKTLALSAYVGLVVSSQLGAGLAELLASRHLDLNGQLTRSQVDLILFVLPILVLEFGRRERGHHRRAGMIMTLILCVLTAALIVSCALSLLDGDTLHRTLGDSSLATAVYSLKTWWIALVPVAVVGENFVRPKD